MCAPFSSRHCNQRHHHHQQPHQLHTFVFFFFFFFFYFFFGSSISAATLWLLPSLSDVARTHSGNGNATLPMAMSNKQMWRRSRESIHIRRFIVLSVYLFSRVIKNYKVLCEWQQQKKKKETPLSVIWMKPFSAQQCKHRLLRWLLSGSILTSLMFFCCSLLFLMCVFVICGVCECYCSYMVACVHSLGPFDTPF